MTDLIERMALAISDTGLLAGDESMDAARAAMSEIRETHAIVPRELIDDLADANSGGDWGEACDAITLWARDRAGEVNGMSRVDAHVREARDLADRLDAISRPHDANIVRQVLRSLATARSTMAVLHRDNLELRAGEAII